MDAAIELIGGALLAGGSLFAVTGGIGLLRMPDFYTRIHAAGLTDTLGAGLILTGLMLYAGPSLVAVKLAAILFFMLITSPTSAHALAKAALARGLPTGGKEEPPSSRS